jgi:hypothetical protein
MKNRFLSFLLLVSFLKIQSQSIDIKWSEQFIYDNKIDGFFDEYIGTNGNNLYARFSNLSLANTSGDSKIKLVAFDKTTMKKVGETELKGYKGSKDEAKYNYHSSIILNKIIYILWTKDAKDVTELYVQSFDEKLKKINGLKKIYEISTSKKNREKLLVLYNNKTNGKILIGKEFDVTNDNEDLRIEYKLINPDFTFITAKQVTLPIVITKRRRGLFSSYYSGSNASYELADDGNLYVQDVLKVSEEEKKSLKKGEASTYTHIMQVQIESGVVKDYKVKFPNKNTFNFSSLITKDGIKLYGFFSDLEKDPKGRDTHGIFYISLDSKNLNARGEKFSYFDKSFLDVLYASDKENQKKGKGLFKSKKAKASDEESIDDNYVIEKVIEDGNDLVIFCSIMNNWSRTYCSTGANGSQSCYTVYYCTKNNVTSFKLNPKGDIVWAKNLDRSITYTGRWNVYDLNIIKNDNNYYVTYGSSFQLNSEKKNRRSRKSRKQITDRLEYAVFSSSTGDYKKAEYKVNPINVKSKEAKFVSPEDIEVFDNRMYTSCTRTKLKPSTYISCLCPPVFYYLNLLSGNSRKGQGYLGTISALK